MNYFYYFKTCNFCWNRSLWNKIEKYLLDDGWKIVKSKNNYLRFEKGTNQNDYYLRDPEFENLPILMKMEIVEGKLQIQIGNYGYLNKKYQYRIDYLFESYQKVFSLLTVDEFSNVNRTLNLSKNELKDFILAHSNSDNIELILVDKKFTEINFCGLKQSDIHLKYCILKNCIFPLEEFNKMTFSSCTFLNCSFYNKKSQINLVYCTIDDKTFHNSSWSLIDYIKVKREAKNFFCKSIVDLYHVEEQVDRIYPQLMIMPVVISFFPIYIVFLNCIFQAISWTGFLLIFMIYYLVSVYFFIPLLAIYILGIIFSSPLKKFKPIFFQKSYFILVTLLILIFYLSIIYLYKYFDTGVVTIAFYLLITPIITLMYSIVLSLFYTIKDLIYPDLELEILPLSQLYKALGILKNHFVTRMIFKGVGIFSFIIFCLSFIEGVSFNQALEDLKMMKDGYIMNDSGVILPMDNFFTGKATFHKPVFQIIPKDDDLFLCDEMTGIFKDGKLMGKGKQIHHESLSCSCGGFITEGFFKNGRLSGKGKKTELNSKNVYIGNFEKGNFSGYGEYIYLNNTYKSYKGNWKSGLPNGYGERISKYKIEKGIWKDGVLINNGLQNTFNKVE
ncbi:MAG: hypothetical protein COB02_04080 [Candidatus Cloacimonadota bacterium]|nr:MAG: hypothetical protein COB02_04080 [Candidatus Cloacimonadota bacterium]